MSVIYANDQPPKGGQVPLLKHAVMQWLQMAHRGGGSRIHGDSYSIANDTRASTSNVLRACYDLQKQGLIQFRERKNAGTNGHGSTTVLTHFTLTPKGIEWDAQKAPDEDFATMSSLKEGDINPALVDELTTSDIARDITVQKLATDLNTLTPPNALASVLRRVGALPIKEANVLLGYNKDSTALYALTKAYPLAFEIQRGRIRFKGPDDWEAPAHGGGRERLPQNVPGTTIKRRQVAAHTRPNPPNPSKPGWHRDPDRPELTRYTLGDTVLGEVEKVGDGYAWAVGDRGGIVNLFGEAQTAVETGYNGTKHTFVDPALMAEAKASVALDGETQSVVETVKRGHMTFGPLISDLLTREVKRQKVAVAVAALEAAGLDDDALTVLTRIPDDTPLEQEIISVLRGLGLA